MNHIPATFPGIVTTQYNQSHASHIFRLNGSIPSVFDENPFFTNSSTGSLQANFYIGGRLRPVGDLYMNGAISELLLYERSLSEEEILSVEGYMMRRYR